MSLYLTAAISRVSVADRVPAIAYQTSADIYVTICNSVIALIAIENAVLGKVMAGGQLSASAAKWLDGLLFLAILLGYGLWNVVFWMRAHRQQKLSMTWMHEKVRVY